MDRSLLLENLDRAVERATSMAITQHNPIHLSKKTVIIGKVSINKNDNGTYDILGPSGKIVYEGISVFDVAVIIAQRHNSGDFSCIREVIRLEEQFSKHRSDMTNYLSSMRSAKKNNNEDRLAILEDRFQISELRAKNTRDRISFFKRTK